MRGVLCMRLVEVSGVRGILTGAGLGEGGAEFAGGVGYEGAGAEELGERCGDMGGGGQDHSPPYCCPCRPRPAQARMPRGAVLWSFSRDRDHDHNLGGDRRHHRSGGPGESHPRAPTDPCVTVSRYTALVVLVLWRAGFTQAQCAKYRGRFPAASAMARMAFLQDRSFLYFFMDHRSR